MAATASVTAIDTPCQPKCSATRASNGRKTSCPAAAAEKSRPIAKPFRSTNHRFATVAAMPTAPAPEPIMVDLVRAGRSPDDLAREFEPSGHSIRAWIAQVDRNEGRREEAAPGLTAFERDELTRLRRENKQLRLERDILSKAAAWFARETGTLPSGSSGS